MVPDSSPNYKLSIYDWLPFLFVIILIGHTNNSLATNLKFYMPKKSYLIFSWSYSWCLTYGLIELRFYSIFASIFIIGLFVWLFFWLGCCIGFDIELGCLLLLLLVALLSCYFYFEMFWHIVPKNSCNLALRFEFLNQRIGLQWDLEL